MGRTPEDFQQLLRYFSAVREKDRVAKSAYLDANLAGLRVQKYLKMARGESDIHDLPDIESSPSWDNLRRTLNDTGGGHLLPGLLSELLGHPEEQTRRMLWEKHRHLIELTRFTWPELTANVGPKSTLATANFLNLPTDPILVLRDPIRAPMVPVQTQPDLVAKYFAVQVTGIRSVEHPEGRAHVTCSTHLPEVEQIQITWLGMLEHSDGSMAFIRPGSALQDIVYQSLRLPLSHEPQTYQDLIRNAVANWLANNYWRPGVDEFSTPDIFQDPLATVLNALDYTSSTEGRSETSTVTAESGTTGQVTTVSSDMASTMQATIDRFGGDH